MQFRRKSPNSSCTQSPRIENLENRNLLAGDAFDAATEGIPEDGMPFFEAAEFEVFAFEDFGFHELDPSEFPEGFMEEPWNPDDMDSDFGFGFEVPMGELPEDFEVIEFDMAAELPADFFGGEMFFFDPFFSMGENDFRDDMFEIPEGELPDGITIGEDGELIIDEDLFPEGVEVIDIDLEGELPDGVTVDENGEWIFEDGEFPEDFFGDDMIFVDPFCPVDEHDFGGDMNEIPEGELPDGITIGEDGELIIDEDLLPEGVEVIDIDLEGELPDGVTVDENGEWIFEDGELPDGITIGEDGELIIDEDLLPEGVEVIDIDLEGELPDGVTVDENGEWIFEDGEFPEDFFGDDMIFVDPFCPVDEHDFGGDMNEIPEGELPDGITIGEDGELIIDEDLLPEGVEVIDIDLEGELPDGVTVDENGEWIFDGEIDWHDVDPFCPIEEHDGEDPTDKPETDETPEEDGSEGDQPTDPVESTSMTARTLARRSDFDGNGVTEFGDFLILAEAFGQEVDQVFAQTDLNGDGNVGFDDFLIFSADFGDA